jgi:hypothetical protein
VGRRPCRESLPIPAGSVHCSRSYATGQPLPRPDCREFALCDILRPAPMPSKAPSAGYAIPDVSHDGRHAIETGGAARSRSWWVLAGTRKVDGDGSLGSIAAGKGWRHIDLQTCRLWGKWRPLRDFLRNHRLSFFTFTILILIAFTAVVTIKYKMGRIPRGPWFGALSGKTWSWQLKEDVGYVADWCFIALFTLSVNNMGLARAEPSCRSCPIPLAEWHSMSDITLHLRALTAISFQPSYS